MASGRETTAGMCGGIRASVRKKKRSHLRRYSRCLQRRDSFVPVISGITQTVIIYLPSAPHLSIITGKYSFHFSLWCPNGWTLLCVLHGEIWKTWNEIHVIFIVGVKNMFGLELVLYTDFVMSVFVVLLHFVFTFVLHFAACSPSSYYLNSKMCFTLSNCPTVEPNCCWPLLSWAGDLVVHTFC